MINGAPLIPAALDCGEIIFRVLSASRWVDSHPDAFMLRESEKVSGLSVAYNCSPTDARSGFAKSYGVLSLLTGKVRDLRLDVIPDESTHANIVGLPYKEDDPINAERLASALAKLVRVVELGLIKK